MKAKMGILQDMTEQKAKVRLRLKVDIKDVRVEASVVQSI